MKILLMTFVILSNTPDHKQSIVYESQPMGFQQCNPLQVRVWQNNGFVISHTLINDSGKEIKVPALDAACITRTATGAFIYHYK